MLSRMMRRRVESGQSQYTRRGPNTTTLLGAICTASLCSFAFAQDPPAVMELPPETPEGSSPGTIGEVVYSNPYPGGGGWYWLTGDLEVGDDLHLARSGNLISFTFTVYAYAAGLSDYDAIVRFYPNLPGDSLPPSGTPLAEVLVEAIPANTIWTQTVDLPDVGLGPVPVPQDIWMTVQLVGLSEGSLLMNHPAPTLGTSHNVMWLGPPFYWVIYQTNNAHVTVRLEESLNTPPVAVCGVDINAEAEGAYGALVQLDGLSSYDPDGDLILYHWDVSDASVVLDDPSSPMPSGLFPIGITMATLTVNDGNGGVDACDVLVTVQDTTPPEVMCSSDLAMLWPPTHDMRDIEIYVMGTDAVASSGDIEIVSVTLRSDELDDADGVGDGETTGDVNGLDGNAGPIEVAGLIWFDAALGDNGTWVIPIQLRAERDGDGDGRCYTIDVTARDTSGNESTTSCCIVVPHDRRQQR